MSDILGLSARWRDRFPDQFYGGGAGGSNPASAMVGQFGGDIETFAQNLNNWFWQLAGEDKMAMAQLNPDIAAMLTQSMDPQQALYQQTLQSTIDQTRSAEAARGLATTPIGAQSEAGTVANFNIDWQNQQLQRELAGIGGATGAYQGLIGAGAAAAQPEEAALSGVTSAFQTASQAKTSDLNRAQQEQASTMGAIGSLAGGGK